MSLLSLIIKQEHIFCLCWNILQIPGRSWWPQKSLWKVTTTRSFKYPRLNFKFLFLFILCIVIICPQIPWIHQHAHPPSPDGGHYAQPDIEVIDENLLGWFENLHWTRNQRTMNGSILKPGFQVEAKGRRHSPALRIVYCAEYFGSMILYKYKRKTQIMIKK